MALVFEDAQDPKVSGDIKAEAEKILDQLGVELGRIRQDFRSFKELSDLYENGLLDDPWTVEIGEHNGFPVASSKLVRIANPVGFFAHKILIHTKRTRQKFAKDILYIHDTLETFGAQLEELKTEWNRKVKRRVHAKSVRKIERAAADLFGEVTDEIREAARIDATRNLSPEAVRERCSFGLRQIFSN